MITAHDWSLNINRFGSAAEGLNDIIQCINIIFTTQKGSDPFRPDFGIDLMKWLDTPVDVCTPGIIAEMIAALDYEPRAIVTNITAKVEFEKVRFNVQGSVVTDKRQQGATPIDLTFVLLMEDGTIFLNENDTGIIIQ